MCLFFDTTSAYENMNTKNFCKTKNTCKLQPNLLEINQTLHLLLNVNKYTSGTYSSWGISATKHLAPPSCVHNKGLSNYLHYRMMREYKLLSS